MHPLLRHTRPSREIRIASVVKTRRSVRKNSAVNSFDKPVVIEIVDRSRKSCSVVRHQLREEWFPAHAEVCSQVWRHLPTVGCIEVQSSFVDFEFVGCSLLERRGSSSHEVAHAKPSELAGEIERTTTDEVRLLIDAPVGCTHAESELMIPFDRGHVIIELILRWYPVRAARHLYSQAGNSTGYGQIRNPLWGIAAINVGGSCVTHRKILLRVLMIADAVDRQTKCLNRVGPHQV